VGCCDEPQSIPTSGWKWISVTKQTDTDRLSRIRLLSTELDIETGKTEERTRSIGTKAAFLVLTAGILSSKIYPQVAQTEYWVVGIIPIALSLVAALTATAALFPWRAHEVKPSALVSLWVNSKASILEMEDYMLEVKSRWITYSNSRNNHRGRFLQIGFIALASAIVAVVAASVLNGS
jgi:hypothetical protein